MHHLAVERRCVDIWRSCCRSHDEIPQVFSLRFCILQAIKNWRRRRTGNEAKRNEGWTFIVSFCSNHLWVLDTQSEKFIAMNQIVMCLERVQYWDPVSLRWYQTLSKAIPHIHVPTTLLLSVSHNLKNYIAKCNLDKHQLRHCWQHTEQHGKPAHRVFMGVPVLHTSITLTCRFLKPWNVGSVISAQPQTHTSTTTYTDPSTSYIIQEWVFWNSCSKYNGQSPIYHLLLNRPS